MNRQEQNNWLVYTWGAALKVAITPSPWEAEMVVMMLFPRNEEERKEVYEASLLPVDLNISAALIQKVLQINERRAENLRVAFLDAINYFFEEEDGTPIAEAASHPKPIIPILLK